MLFGTGQLQKEAIFLNNDSLNLQTGTIEIFLKNLIKRQSSVTNERKRSSFVVISSKLIDIDERSRPSMDNE